jgi:outer membrane biosynthesis protein TonB
MAVASLEEAKNKRTAAIIALAVHGIFILICLFFFTFLPPEPPIAEGGIEVDYGLDDEGSGEVRSLAPANTNPDNPDAKAGAPQTQPEPEQQSYTPPAPVKEEPVITSEEESPVEAEDKPPVTKPTPRPVEPKREPVVQKEDKPEPKKPAPEQPKVNKDALFTKKPGAGGLNNGTSDKVAGNNNGDDVGKVGDKGDPRGIMGGKNYEGTPGTGGGNGPSYNIRGWRPDRRITETDNSSETGKIVFEIKIDEEGKFLSAKVLETTVSPSVVAFYKERIQKLTFTPTNDNSVPAPISTGTITFIIKSN